MNLNSDKILNIFYQEPNPDRWIKYDRYPRQIIRRIIRGKQKPGGVMMVALQLLKGLDNLGIPYRFNDFQYAKKNPDELIGVIGKPQLIFDEKFKNPILFGAGVFSHPIDCPDLFEKYPNVKKMLVPGEWMRKMCEPFYHDKVETWPVGIDTDKWKPEIIKDKQNIDFLIYNKIRWNNEYYNKDLVIPILCELDSRNLTYKLINYGKYDHSELISSLSNARAAIFLCEHETQGIAYQQILATNTPILAWDMGGFWLDPSYYPEKVKFKPVSSVPYWNKDCGEKFENIEQFKKKLITFLSNFQLYRPREFIVENLTLEICAEKYYNIYKGLLKT
ncbi:glycosyltransferase [Pedobacter sp. Leaf132]|uniref:glycosyltransferase n=1 Tax=Pedobacter sp. Leaf132 TaxID=2876557 RepID=UPI001E2F125A|nr:glycosyltransferase [Pedobacter sp. Leaf132]